MIRVITLIFLFSFANTTAFANNVECTFYGVNGAERTKTLSKDDGTAIAAGSYDVLIDSIGDYYQATLRGEGEEILGVSFTEGQLDKNATVFTYFHRGGTGVGAGSSDISLYCEVK